MRIRNINIYDLNVVGKYSKKKPKKRARGLSPYKLDIPAVTEALLDVHGGEVGWAIKNNTI